MYKVFIVEDEEILRNGMRKNIKWNETKYELVGEAPDGEAALPFIRELKPDIIITDLKMPFMDGLELSRIVKQEIPETKIIVLTGYDEFDFARKAISIGVDEYVLKPFSSMKIINVLDDVSKKIEDEKNKEIWNYEKRTAINFMKKIDKIKEIKDMDTVPLTLFCNNNQIEEFLKLGNIDQIEEFINEHISKLKKSSAHSYLYVYYIYMNIYMIASNFIKEMKGDLKKIIPEIYEIEEKCLNIDSIEELRLHMIKIFEKTIKFRNENRENKHREIIEKGKKIIKKQYMNPELSLNYVSYHINMSPNHFSAIFKNETGNTFINYLINLRIAKAKEMLNTSSMKICEIAESVGYTDSHYFSSIFKKITGITPSEYRGNN